MREDWINTNTVADDGERLATADEVVEFNAETFKGESV